MRANGSDKRHDSDEVDIDIEKLAFAIEPPEKKLNREMWFWLLMVGLLVGTFLYTVWTLNHSGPAAGTL
jgi:hypothetical protein